MFWYFARGTELYSEIEGHTLVRNLVGLRFPGTDPNDPIDNIIVKYRPTKFRRTADLVDEIQRVAKEVGGLEGIREVKPMSDEQYLAMRERCEGCCRLFPED